MISNQYSKNFNPLEDKYISREFQSYGVHIAEALGDYKHKSLYIKLAKELPRPAIERALRFVIDSTARNKGALFMWKLRQMGVMGKEKSNSKLKDHKSKP
ncbi:MAG: hypothetical protein UZ21_OP11001000357 [Microgenomates bacterium OLB22]|nr:MAG: hypothetical protein UZ21_OP11001000357 [Microgenomates bacterium OLB22]